MLLPRAVESSHRDKYTKSTTLVIVPLVFSIRSKKYMRRLFIPNSRRSEWNSAHERTIQIQSSTLIRPSGAPHKGAHFSEIHHSPNPYKGALLFNIAKIFDKFLYNVLIYNFYQLKLLDWLRFTWYFFSCRIFRYCVHGNLSSPRQICARIPQGSVLSSLLYYYTRMMEARHHALYNSFTHSDFILSRGAISLGKTCRL